MHYVPKVLSAMPVVIRSIGEISQAALEDPSWVLPGFDGWLQSRGYTAAETKLIAKGGDRFLDLLLEFNRVG